MNSRKYVLTACLLAFIVTPAASESGTSNQPSDVPQLASLGKPNERPHKQQVDLGRHLFFDPRLSGDATISCATCHDPEKAWCDGQPLSAGYPGTLYFRNTPSLLNVGQARYVYWDGRLPASDLPTVVRDHISEAHFFQSDGRLLIERLRQVPEYEVWFNEACGGEPTYGRILNSLAAFLSTIRSRGVPFDRYLEGDETAISESARRGIELFRGKAGCIQCHHGPLLSDGSFHNVGVAANKQIFQEPKRHISFRRFFRTMGIAEYHHLRSDPGLYAVTKSRQDFGRFRTPTLREVARTAPYMHNGSLPTLEAVVAFYDQGGGDNESKDPLLKKLNLTKQERDDLVAFLKSLSGEKVEVKVPEVPPYQIRKLGEEP